MKTKLKLWFLTAICPDVNSDPGGPWGSGHDCAHGFVVRAQTQYSARAIAAGKPGDEGHEAWLDETLTRCEELTPQGESEIVLRDFHAG